MLTRVNQFLGYYKEIGSKLKGAQEAYENGLNKLTPGGQSIVEFMFYTSDIHFFFQAS